MTDNHSPLEDFLLLLKQMPGRDDASSARLRERVLIRDLPDTAGLIDLGLWLTSWQEGEALTVAESHICVLASSYAGLTDSAMVTSFREQAASGKTPVNQLCVREGIGLRVLELAPEIPHDPAKGWSEAECMAAVAFGMEATAAGGSLLAIRDLALGNEQIAKDIIAASSDHIVADAGDAKALERLTLLHRRGGREMAASAGAILAARSRRLPVLVEGWGVLAAYQVLRSIDPVYVDHVKIAGFDNEEQQRVLHDLGVSAIIGSPVGVGPGCASALAITVLSSVSDLLR